MPYFLHASALLLSACLIAPAAQACVASETGGALGAVTSKRISGGTAVITSGAFRYACSGAVLSALGNPSLKGQLQPNTSGLTLKNGSYTIPYQIYSDAGNTNAYLGGVLAVDVNGTQLLNLLGTGGGGYIPIYIASLPGANIPAGVYTDIVQVTWTARNICEGLLGLAGLCLGFTTNETVVRSLQISLTVTNDCTITAPAVNFGTAPLVASFPTVSQNIELVCTRNMNYTVGLSDGSYANAGRRRMASGASRLQYDIFKPDNTVWGGTGVARASSPGLPSGTGVQTIPYTARIYTDQSNPPAGTYTDNVVVDVSF